jgi:hypothetical protein
VSLAGQWRSLESGLPAGWRTASLRLELRDRDSADRASRLLGPAQPFRLDPEVVSFGAARDGSAVGPDAVVRLLARIDDARIPGELTLADSKLTVPRPEPAETSLAASWDAALAGLPSDWSDLLCELDLLSSDYIDPAAVLCIQANPRRDGDRNALRFRCARVAGYGVSPQMARRCFERCDDAGIRGSLSVLRALSDTHLVATQGPVWQLEGKTV